MLNLTELIGQPFGCLCPPFQDEIKSAYANLKIVFGTQMSKTTSIMAQPAAAPFAHHQRR
jgi:hypothetical protein